MTPEQARAESERFLAATGIEINPNLPLVEDAGDLTPPDARAVAGRALVLGYLAGIGFGGRVDESRESLQSFGLWEFTSTAERVLLTTAEWTPQQKIDASWLIERIQVLAWGLGLVSMDHLRECDDDLASHFPGGEDPTDFLESASLRSYETIYQESDRIYCLHWAARNASLTAQSSRVRLELIQERHWAINWLVGVESNWDLVPTDT